jgi:hypothetical protein
MHNISDEDLISREHKARLQECEELQRLIGERCREAELRWWATRPWLSSTPQATYAWKFCGGRWRVSHYVALELAK